MVGSCFLISNLGQLHTVLHNQLFFILIQSVVHARLEYTFSTSGTSCIQKAVKIKFVFKLEYIFYFLLSHSYNWYGTYDNANYSDNKIARIHLNDNVCYGGHEKQPYIDWPRVLLGSHGYRARLPSAFWVQYQLQIFTDSASRYAFDTVPGVHT